MSDAIPALFDRRLRALRRDRAARSGAFASADYLHRLAAERLAERFDDTPFLFEQAVILGASDGALGDQIAARGGLREIIEIDAAPSLVAQLAARPSSPDGPARVARIGDAAAPELAPNSCDAIFSLLELHAMDDPLGALIQMRRALRPNGFLLACLFAGKSLFELRAALADAAAAEAARVAPMGEVRDLGGLLQRAGLSMPVSDIERLTLWHQSPLALMRELRAMGETNIGPNVRRGPSRETLARAAAAYSARFARADGKTRATVEIAFLTGWKPGPNQPRPKRPGSATARLADALGVVERPAGEPAAQASPGAAGPETTDQV